MSTKLRTGYDRKQYDNIPEGRNYVDVSSPLGRSTLSAIFKANKTGDFENITNVLEINKNVQIIDGNDTSTEYCEEVEVYVLKAIKGGAMLETRKLSLAEKLVEMNTHFIHEIKTVVIKG